MADDRFNQEERYHALMDVIQKRMTNPAFDPDYVVPKAHYDMILEGWVSPMTCRSSTSCALAHP